MDIGQIRGQRLAKAGVLVAAAGRHNILLSGPPGNGKSSLIKAMEDFLPTQTWKEFNEVKEIYKFINIHPGMERPFIEVSPQVTSTELLGGGHNPTPGSISLAHSGILFMDEFPEYDRKLLDSLRGVLENKYIEIFRGGKYETFLADFQLACAMNTCPCGYYTENFLTEDDLFKGRYCKCTKTQLERYRKKLSGPILDRIDMFISMEQVEVEEMFKPPLLGEGNDFQRQVNEACIFRLDRNQQSFNSEISGPETYNPTSKIYQWTDLGLAYLKIKADEYSARKLSKLARVSRTVADLLGDLRVDVKHICFASYFVRNSLIG